MGGRGSSSGGESLGGGSGQVINIVNSVDVWSYRHNQNNEPFVDAINTSVRAIENDFPGIMSETVNSVDATEFGGNDRYNTLGCWGSDGVLSMNRNYTNIDKMNAVYDNTVKSGYHPSRGDKSGTEAVTFHEMGHAVTDHVAKNGWGKDIDDASKTIVDYAYSRINGKGGTKAAAGKISKYAQKNNAECVAEAFADYYCNGSKAKRFSKAIVDEAKRLSRTEPIPFS